MNNNEWYTPPKYIEAARTVMGSIDLDPASCKEANDIVKAAKYYTLQDNGLVLPWHGNIWLNPPYGRDTFNKSSQENWIKVLFDHYRQGRIMQAILLCTADTDEKWFRPLWQCSLCFADHHVWFLRPGKTREKQMFGTVFAYLGNNHTKFLQVFSQFGPAILHTSIVRKNYPETIELWQSYA